MKINKSVTLPGLFTIIIALGANAPAQPAEKIPDLGAAVPSAATAAEFPADQGLRFAIHGTSLEDVLTYMSRAAGFVIYLRPGVQINGTVEMFSAQPVNQDEAVKLLQSVLNDHGYSVIQEGRTLTILNTRDITPETHIMIGNDPAKIPRDAQVVTQIIPVRTLNPVELQKVLVPLLPLSAKLEVNESANSLLLTDTQAGVHRVAEIIAALDSVSASANTLRIFPLHYADAQELAGLIKELFAADTSSTGGARGNARGNTLRVNQPGGPRGAFPGGLAPGGNQNGADNGQTPVSRVAAVADEHGNALIVSAPEALLVPIAQLVESLDAPVEDVTEVQVFELKNADPVEMASLLAGLFPDDTSSSDAGGRTIQFGGQGGRGAQVGVRQGTPSNNNPSDRMQKLGRVLAVPDARTGSLLVSAAKSLMPQIVQMVNQLDVREGNKQEAHLIPLKYAEVWEVQQILQDLFPSANVSTGSTGQSDPFKIRSDAMFSAMFSGGAGSGAGLSSGRGTSAGRNGL